MVCFDGEGVKAEHPAIEEPGGREGVLTFVPFPSGMAKKQSPIQGELDRAQRIIPGIALWNQGGEVGEDCGSGSKVLAMFNSASDVPPPNRNNGEASPKNGVTDALSLEIRRQQRELIFQVESTVDVIEKQ
jgi:hypothetical protein